MCPCCMSGNLCIFALAFESESCKQEKHCDIVLVFKIGKILSGKVEHLCFRLVVYAICIAYRQA